jgi:hypothetical protein
MNMIKCYFAPHPIQYTRPALKTSHGVTDGSDHATIEGAHESLHVIYSRTATAT